MQSSKITHSKRTNEKKKTFHLFPWNPLGHILLDVIMCLCVRIVYRAIPNIAHGLELELEKNETE